MSDIKEKNNGESQDYLINNNSPENRPDHEPDNLPEKTVYLEPDVHTEVVQEKAPELKYYDIIYGVLFDPVKTMRRLVEKPPVTATLIIVIALTLVELLTSLYITAQGSQANLGLEMGLPLSQARAFSEALRAAAPVMAVLGAIFYFLKWFFYSALLHLLAEFFGGQGRARTVFVVYGLAGLPAALMIPINVLAGLALPTAATTISTIGGLLVLVWGIVLLVIGIREAHLISTGRAVGVVLTPVLALLLLLLVSIIGVISTLSSFMPQMMW